MSALLDAVDVLNDRLVAADAIGEALDLAGGETPPAWVSVYRHQVEAIREAAESVETLVRRGMGGIPPMETQSRPVGNATSRDGSQRASDAASRPEKQAV